MVADLQRRTEEARSAGREVVSLPPRLVEPQPEPASGKLELPLLTGVDPEVVREVMQGSECDLENTKVERFVPPIVPEEPR
jgi:hypothetical protein